MAIGMHRTLVIPVDGGVDVYFHQTKIVEVRGDTVTLNSGGFRTATTKRRMNQVLEDYGFPLKVVQEEKVWKVKMVSREGVQQIEFEFFDGISIQCEGMVV